MSSEDELDLSVHQPIRAVELRVAHYQWDAWVESAGSAARKADFQAIFLGVLAALFAGAVGFEMLDSDAQFSALVYSPLLGLGVWYALRSRLDSRYLSRVVEDLRAAVVPKLVNEITDEDLTRLARLGGVVVPNESIVIVARRRDSEVALVASEYDMSKAANWPALIWLAGIGGADGGGEG